MSVFWCIATCYFLATTQTEAARILAVYPTPSFSHQVVFRALTKALVDRGHEVTVITTDPAYPEGGAPLNLTEIDVHDISYETWTQEIMAMEVGQEADLVSQMASIWHVEYKIIDNQLKDKRVQSLIKNKDKQFDLLMSEALARPVLAFSHIYKIPVIQVSSLGGNTENYETVGAPVHPFLYPGYLRRRINNLTMWEKVKELYVHYRYEKMVKDFHIIEDNIVRKHFGIETPSVLELLNNVHMLFLNVHPLLEGIRPVPPNVVYMGGIHQIPEKELPEDLKTYLDSSKNGVIYVSFGTNVEPSRFAAEKLQAFINVFSQLPYDVLWKWNTDELPGRTDNIRISKWLPQSDLLRHPKVKLFITQGGLQSTDEAITAGVPLIGMPMWADQFFNVEKYEYHKIGIRLDLEILTEEKLKTAINKIIGDDSYRRNIVRLNNWMRDEPQSSVDRAVWWTEHVLRHGGALHLRSPSANISWSQYLELELLLTLLAVLLIAATFIIVALRLVYKYVLKRFFIGAKIKRS